MTLTTLTKKHYICINIDSISLKKIETSQQNSPNNKVYKRYIPDKKKYMIPSILIIEDDLTFATMLKTWLGKKVLKSIRQVVVHAPKNNSLHVLTTSYCPTYDFLTRTEYICWHGFAANRARLLLLL